MSRESTFVMDSSSALALLLPDEKSGADAAALRKLLDAQTVLHVPAHWMTEVANGLLMAERRRRISQMELGELLDIALSMNVETDNDAETITVRETVGLGRQHGLTFYDAAYLELAMRRGMKLATLDAALRKAAAVSGIQVLP